MQTSLKVEARRSVVPGITGLGLGKGESVNRSKMEIEQL
jgi:hypothetical protein